MAEQNVNQLGDLTNAETLWLWRRRKNLNQIQAAAECSVAVDTYRLWESGKSLKAPRKNLGRLRKHEVCYILRRRRGWTQRKLAELLSCTRLWVIQMEEGTAPVDRLAAFWGV